MTNGEVKDDWQGMRVLRELDQDRITQRQRIRSEIVNVGSLKMRANPTGRDGINSPGDGLEKSVNRNCINGKKRFCLVEDDDSIDTVVQNGKEIKMRQEEMNMVDIFVEETSHKRPQVDQ